MGSYVKGRHDCGLTNTDGSITGLMLTRKNNVPNYGVFYDQYLANQFFTGTPGYGSLPAEKELALRQDSWRSGFGLDSYDPNDPERYLSAKNMDLRFRGMGIAGTKATALGTITTPAWASPVGHNDPNSTWNNEANAYDGSTTTAAGEDAHANATWGNFLELYSKTPVTISQVRYWASEPGAGQIDIDLYYGGAWNDLSSGAATLGQYVTVAVSPSQTVSAARVRFYNSSGGSSGGELEEFDFYVTAVAGGNVKTAADFNDLHYIGIEDVLYKLNGAGDGLTWIKYMGANITDLEVMTISGTEYLFIALGTATDYQYMVAAETFTTSTAVVKRFKYFKVVNAASPTMWGSDGDVTLRSTVNPLNGGTAWSGQTTVDAASNVITGMFTDAGSLYINKEDMPYYLDSTGAVKSDLAPILATLPRSTDNGKSANYWLGNFYLPWGRSLLEEDGGTLTWRSPNDMATNLSAFAGQVFAIAGDDRYLYAVADNGTNVEVLAGRLEVIDGTTKWVWHPINETTLTGCESAWVTSVYQKRLWISSTSSSDSLYYIPLPLAYGDILADANRDFISGGEYETPWLHGNFKDTTKAFPELTITMLHNYDADIYFATHYKTLSNSTYTKIADMKGSTTSMVQTNSLPDAGANHPVDTDLRLKFVVNTDDSTKTPVLGSYKLKGFLNAPQRRIIALQVRCAQELLLNDGGKDTSSFNVIKATMDELVKATWPVAFTDIAGTVTNVRPLPVNREWWQVSAYEKGREQERIYNLLLQEI